MKTKTLLPLLILGQSFLVSNYAIAQQQETKDAANTKSESSVAAEDQELKEANTSWDNMNGWLKSQLENASLKFSNRLLGITKGNLNAGADYGYESDPTIAGQYLSVDRWSLGLSYLPANGLGGSVSREVVYIDKFPNRRASLVRKAYNPIARLPINSEKALALKEFQFVGFRAPLTLSLGASSLKTLSEKANLPLNVKVFLTGEVDVQVYRMPGDLVRVRLFALKEKGLTGSVGLQLVGLNLLTKTVFDMNPVDVFATKSKSDLFSIDYVFNLANAESRAQYDQLLDKKYNVTGMNNLKAQVTGLVTTNAKPGSNNESFKELFYRDLEGIQSIVNRDITKDLNERAIVQLRTVENATSSTTMGINLGISKIAKLMVRRTDANTSISMTNIENNKKDYLLKTSSKEFNTELFTLFGQESKTESGLLASADEKFNAQDVLGFQTRSFKKSLNYSQAEYTDLKRRLQKNLPAEILNHVKWPKWNFAGSTLKNISIEQLIFFNVQALQQIGSINTASIQTEMHYLIKNWGRFGSQPENSNDYIYGGTDPRLDAYNRRNYEEAYVNELKMIPQYLMVILNSKDVEERLQNFHYLQDIPLFHEIGAALMLRLLPTDRLAEAINYRLALSGSDENNVRGELTNYPDDTTKQQYINVVASAIAETAYVSERSFNIKLFIDEKGNSISLAELAKLAK